MRARKHRAALNKQQQQEANRRKHWGETETYDDGKQALAYIKVCLAATKPYFNNGRKRKAGSLTEHLQFMDHLQRLVATLLPYERPRLAAVTVHSS
jgi:hypothetical protein